MSAWRILSLISTYNIVLKTWFSMEYVAPTLLLVIILWITCKGGEMMVVVSLFSGWQNTSTIGGRLGGDDTSVCIINYY